MNNVNIRKENFIKLFNQLDFDNKNIVINTFRCLASNAHSSKGFKPYDVAGVIKYHQKKLNYSNKDVCEKVNNLIDENNDPSDEYLSVNTFQKIISRNTQSSKDSTNFLHYIALALEFDEDEYKYLSKEGLQDFTLQSYNVNTIDTLYDLLSEKEKNAILQLTTSLLGLSIGSNQVNESIEETVTTQN